MSDNKHLPAYPNVDSYESGGTCTNFGGLTKRELIAAMCLQGLLANPDLVLGGQEIEVLAINHADTLLHYLSNTQP